MATLLFVLSIILIILSILLLFAVPPMGIAGIALGIILIICSRKMKKGTSKASTPQQPTADKVAQSAAKYANSKELGYCYIAGLYHHKPAVKSILDDGSYEGPCELIPEPENEFDPNAIRIEVNGNHIGYVPAKMCESVHEKLPEVAACYAEIEMDSDGDMTGKVTMYKA